MHRTLLEERIEPLLKKHPGRSGFVALPDGYDAFASRMMLADLAEETIDIQYYIWKKDITGTLLFDALYRAAERGVRIRLLLDDNNTSGLDDILLRLNAHPRIEVRLFNPYRHRKWRVVDYLTDLVRVNRRMHNKTFTVDGEVTIIGGRNIGDEYFNAGQGLLFIDLDALAVGPVVEEVSRDFERYWQSEPARPLEEVLGYHSDHTAREAPLFGNPDSPEAADYLEQLRNSPYSRGFPHEGIPFEWTLVRMVSDDPEKATGRASESTYLPEQLRETLLKPRKELFLVAPYFVPGKRGRELITTLTQRGVRVYILTNSFEATDVGIVHSGYIKHRKSLLRAGVTLYELKRSAAGEPSGRQIRGGSAGLHAKTFSSSFSSLHAKTFSVDHSDVFIGSFNFDPRSALLNTEIGFIVESPGNASRLADIFATRIPEESYEVRLTEQERLVWIEQDDGRQIVHKKEPGVGILDRIVLWVLSRLPIEWLL